MKENRIILRAVEISDVQKIYQYENDITAWSEGITTRFYSEYAITEYVKTVQNEDIFSAAQSRMMIQTTPAYGGLTVGCADLYDIDCIHSRAGVGIYIEQQYRNRRFASESIDKLCKYAFNTLNLHQLYAFIRNDNAQSLHIFTENGFVHTSTLQQWLKCGNSYYDVNVLQRINH